MQLDGVIHEGGVQRLVSTPKVEKFHPHHHLQRDLGLTELNSGECSAAWKFFIIQQRNYFSITPLEERLVHLSSLHNSYTYRFTCNRRADMPIHLYSVISQSLPLGVFLPEPSSSGKHRPGAGRRGLARRLTFHVIGCHAQ